MKTVISMKMIMIDDWSLHNKLKASMLIEPSVSDLEVYLMCYPVNLFYYRLVVFIYNTLDGGDRPVLL